MRLKQTGLRVPQRLYPRLIKAAKKNKQSLNSEMVERITKSFWKEDFVNAVRTVLREEKS